MLWMCNKVILSHCQLYTCVYSLSGNKIDDEGARSLGVDLRMCRSLQTLK